jgi:glycosyltransferase involved in cell wall biosynthesis
MALAVRALGCGGGAAAPDPAAVLRMVERLMTEGDARSGPIGADLCPDDARALLRAWLEAVDLRLSERDLLALLQSDGFSHGGLERRARRRHEARLRDAAARAARAAAVPAGAELLGAVCAVIPYAAAAGFIARERRRLAGEGGPVRVALVADGIGATHGVARALEEVRERGVPGFDVEVIGTDRAVDRRLGAPAELDVPFYPGLRVGVPALTAVVEALADGRYDLVHVCAPGPAGAAAWMVARTLELPLLGSYHTELAAYAGLRSGAASLQAIAGAALGAFYGACDVVLSPSPASDERLAELGIASPRVGRWDRGVDLDRFDPRLRDADMFGGKVNVLYCGRLTREKGVDLLADAFLRAREEDPRLHLVLAGGGPEEGALRERLGEHGTFLGWLSGSDLPKAYASADAFLFASRTDTFGQVILEAQASGLPVIAVGEGGPTSLIADGESGLLTAPTAEALAGALLSVVRTPALRERLSKTALAILKERTWGASLRQLAAGYRSALLRGAAPGRARAA